MSTVENISAEEYNERYGKRRNKYGAKRVVIDGIAFASQAEGQRYRDLKLMADAGAIRDLTLQQAYDLTVNGITVAKYLADFVYIDNDTGERVVEDVKGFRHPVYRLKKKLMQAIYGIEIKEIQV